MKPLMHKKSVENLISTLFINDKTHKKRSMSEKQLYWQKDGYVPTDEDLCKEWENENADYFNMHRKAIEEFLEREDKAEDCGEFIGYDSLNLFIRACEEAGELSDFAAKLVDWIDDSQYFRDELTRSEVACASDVIQFVNANSDLGEDPVWDTVVGVASNCAYAEKQVKELIEEVKYLRGLLDDNGISYTTKLSKNMNYPGLYLMKWSR